MPISNLDKKIVKIPEFKPSFEVKPKTKEILTDIDYDTIGKICNRVIKQLRGKIPEKSENSDTADIVIKAFFLKKKLIQLGLIYEITPEIIKEIKEVE